MRAVTIPQIIPAPGSFSSLSRSLVAKVGPSPRRHRHSGPVQIPVILKVPQSRTMQWMGTWSHAKAMTMTLPYTELHMVLMASRLPSCSTLNWSNTSMSRIMSLMPDCPDLLHSSPDNESIFHSFDVCCWRCQFMRAK